jgi:predicted MFS family arabinose efflux permease
MSAAADSTPSVSGPGDRARLKRSFFILEWLNALATAYYFNYLFFYMLEHFGFGNRNNLLITALYGFVYMFSAWYAGRIARKHGYMRLLRFGFGGMGVAMVCGGLIPHAFGYSRGAEIMQFAIVVAWTMSMCFTWPTLQSLVSQGESPEELPRTAGIYNIVWASAAAVAYLTGGALFQWIGGEVLTFWLPAAIHAVQLVLLRRCQRSDAPGHSPASAAAVPVASTQELNPRPISKARGFLMLAWIANPFAYIAIYGVLPVIPNLTNSLGLDAATAGVVCSVWFWTRLTAFVWFWLWPGWHYRFGWLLGAFITLIASFAAILLIPHVWTLVLAQIVFGLAVGLIYYSSLYYSMDTGASKGKEGGIHEAAIGLGIFLGPAAGVSALQIFPHQPNAGTYNIGGLLILGLVIFLLAQMRNRAT